jgi:hypothetical protein
MRLQIRTSIYSILGFILLVAGICSLCSCSSHEVAEHQQGITDAHQSMIDRREARQEARDQRFQSSRDSWMN